MKNLIVLLSVFGFVGLALSAETLEAIRARIVAQEEAKKESSVSSPVSPSAPVASRDSKTNSLPDEVKRTSVEKEGMGTIMVASVADPVDEEIPPTDPRSPHYRDSRVETHRVVLARNSRDEVVGTNYITEVRDYATGQNSYRVVRHLIDPPPPPQVVVVEQSCCDPQPCCGGNSYGGRYYSGGYHSGGSWSGNSFPGSAYGGQYYSGGYNAGNYRAGERWSTSGYGKSSSSGSWFSAGGGFGGTVYPRTVRTYERTYSWGFGTSVGAGVSSGLSRGGGNFSSGSTYSR